MRRSGIRKAIGIKNAYISNELENIVQKLETSQGKVERSAVHHMILREKSFAQKEGRNPEYISPVLIDEVSTPLITITMNGINEIEHPDFWFHFRRP